MARGWRQEPPVEEIKVGELKALIPYKMEKLGLDDELVSAKIQMKKDTFRKKRKHPETFRYVEIIRLMRALELSDEEMLSVV